MDPRERRIRYVTHGAWMVAVPILAAAGVAGRQILKADGVPVLSWRDGMALFVPLALFHLLPVLIYTAMIRRACLRAFRGEGRGISRYLLAVIAGSVSAEREEEFPDLLYAVTGACVALVAFAGVSVFGAVLYSGPGGLAEVVMMTLGMLPLTLGYVMLLGLVSLGAGGLLGIVLRRLLQRARLSG